MIEIQGFTVQQQRIAEQLWQARTAAELARVADSLPPEQRRDAWAVLQMIIAAELDKIHTVEPEITEYLRRY